MCGQLMDILLISWWLGIASLVAQRLKRLPSMWETQVRSLGREDTLEKEMVTHSSILAKEITSTDESGRLQFLQSQKNWTYLVTKQQQSLFGNMREREW